MRSNCPDCADVIAVSLRRLVLLYNLRYETNSGSVLGEFMEKLAEKARPLHIHLCTCAGNVCYSLAFGRMKC